MIERKKSATWKLVGSLIIISTLLFLPIYSAIATATSTAASSPVAPGELTLEQAIQLAYEQNQELQLQRSQVRLAEAQEYGARQTKKDLDAADLPGGPGEVAKRRVMKDVIPYQARQNVELQKHLLEQKRLTLKGQVENAYLQVLEAEENLQLAQTNLQRTQRSHEMVLDRLQNGMAAESERIDSEVFVTQAETNLIASQHRVEMAWVELNQLLNRPLTERDQLQHVTAAPIKAGVELEQLLSLALEHRPDLKGAQLAVTTETDTLAIYQELLNGSSPEVREQRVKQEQAELKLALAQSQIAAQVEQAYLGWQSASIQIPMLEQNQISAQESLRLAEIRYENGLGTTFEILSAQLSLQEAENRLLQGKYGQLRAWSNLEKAIAAPLPS